MEYEGKVYEDRGRTMILGRFCFLAPCVCWRIFKPLNWFTHTYTRFGLTRALSVFTMRLFNGLASLLAGAGLVQATLQIVSGGTWSAVRNKHSPSSILLPSSPSSQRGNHPANLCHDTIQTNTGRHIQAHGAGVTKVGSTYYLIGEDKTEGSAFQNINCYSSTNLVEWTYVGALLSRTTAAGDLGPSRVVERPKVIYNSATKKYVMYMHIDSSSYGEAKIGVATSDTVCGKYTYLSSWQPLGFQSRDIGLFQDDDGSAYLLTEDVSSEITHWIPFNLLS